MATNWITGSYLESTLEPHFMLNHKDVKDFLNEKKAYREDSISKSGVPWILPEPSRNPKGTQ